MKIHISAANLQITVRAAESEDDSNGCDLHDEDGSVLNPPLLFQYSAEELSQFIDVAALIRETGSLAGLVRLIEAQLLEAATVQ